MSLERIFLLCIVLSEDIRERECYIKLDSGILS